MYTVCNHFDDDDMMNQLCYTVRSTEYSVEALQNGKRGTSNNGNALSYRVVRDKHVIKIMFNPQLAVVLCETAKMKKHAGMTSLLLHFTS